METFSALLALCAGNSPVSGEFPAQRPVTRSFDVFYDICLNKRLSKQSWGWWFETPSSPLWRHCNNLYLFRAVDWNWGNSMIVWVKPPLRMRVHVYYQSYQIDGYFHKQRNEGQQLHVFILLGILWTWRIKMYMFGIYAPFKSLIHGICGSNFECIKSPNICYRLNSGVLFCSRVNAVEHFWR